MGGKLDSVYRERNQLAAVIVQWLERMDMETANE